MKQRIATLAALGALAVGAVVLFAVGADLGRAQTVVQRTPFLIATGPSGGTYFPVGQTIAGIISNPPGVDRCQTPDACGPRGLIASARTSDGAVENVLAVNSGSVDSGLAQADVVFDAEHGRGAFRKSGKQSHVEILAGLFSEDVNLVVAAKSRIGSIGDLKGKRVSLGVDGSGTEVTVQAVLAAFGLSERSMKATHESADAETEQLEDGKLDAFFFVGAAPVPLISDLLAHGTARLVAIDGVGRSRLAKTVPTIQPSLIPANTYPHTGAIQTVRVRALWIVRDSIPPPLAYSILKALYNPENRGDLDSIPATRAIRVDDAARDLPAPLHPGALRFFRESGKI
jgi:TRAP transporter TAXI family solute receptor